MLTQKLKVDSRLRIKAVYVRLGNELDKIFISDLVFHEKNKMVTACITLSLSVLHRARGYIHLAADNSLYTFVSARREESISTEKIAVVRDRYSIMSVFLCCFRYFTYPASTVKQTVLRVQMKMNKLTHTLLLLSCSLVFSLFLF